MASRTLSLLSIAPSPSTSCCRFSIDYSPLAPPCFKSNNLTTSLTGQKLFLRSSSPLHYVLKQNSTAVATISFSLPTANPDRSTENSPKWSARAIKAFGLGESEARKLKLAKTGTESLILGILVEGTSLAAKFLRENGVTIAKVQEEVVNLLGKSSICARTPERPPLSQQAQRALDWAVNEKLKSGEAGEVTTTHLLLGIWSEKESAGHKILSTLGVNDDKLKDLAKSGNIDYVFSFRRGLL